MPTTSDLRRAAIEIFLEKGYGGARVEDIARRAGLTSGALYAHFESRAALINESIVDEAGAAMAQWVEQAESASSSKDRVPAVLAALRSLPASVADQLCLEAWALASRSEVATGAVRGTVESVAEALAAAVDDAVDDAESDRDALRDIVTCWALGAVVVRALGLDTADDASVSEVERRLAPGGAR